MTALRVVVAGLCVIAPLLAEAARYPTGICLYHLTSIHTYLCKGPASCAADPDCTPHVVVFFEPLCLMVYTLWILTVVGCIFVCGGNVLAETSQLRVFSVAASATPESQNSILKPESQSSIHNINTDSTSEHNALGDEADEQLLLAGEDRAVDVQGEERMYMIGYRDDASGWVVMGLVAATSVSWVALYITLVADYYSKCEFTGIDNCCFYGDYPIFGDYNTNASVAFFWAVTSSLWFITLVLLGSKLRNLFREPCSLQEATSVYCWTPDHTEVFVHDRSPVVELFYRCKARCVSTVVQGRDKTVPVLFTAAQQQYVLFECTRYLLHSRGFSRAQLEAAASHAELQAAKEGLEPSERQSRLDLLGDNSIPFHVDTLGEACFKEFFRYYYVYQYAALGVWLWWSYLWVSGLLVLVVLGAAAVNITISRDGQETICQMTSYHTTLFVKQGLSGWTEVDSNVLVPGDVVRVRGGWVSPCDLALVTGSAIVDESGLTGESMPVRKVEVEDEDVKFALEGKSSKHCIFAGTKVLQAGVGGGDDSVEAVVVSTGIGTSKGQLVAQILFPTQMQFKYDEELPVVFVMLLCFGALATSVGVYFRLSNGAMASFHNSWPTLICMASQICHPLLPMALTVGQAMSCKRLKEIQVFCLDPKRISISGKIKVFCFDKTGTLTKEGLDFLGCHPVDPTPEAATSQGFAPLVHEGFPDSMGALPSLFQHALATCHCVSTFGDGFVGNQVEMKMFEATGWKLVETPGQLPVVHQPDNAASLQIARRFDFDHALQTMSVVVKEQGGAGELVVFTKGSYEQIKQLCDPTTIPPLYDEVSKAHAIEGCYVLAMASRSLGSITDEALQALSRGDVEAEGTSQLLGLILFRNELKPDTKDAVLGIKQGGIRCVMITGDNAHCGSYIARASGLVDEGAPLLMGTLNPTGCVKWSLSGAVDVEEEPMSSEVMIQQGLHVTHELGITGDTMLHALEAQGVLGELLFNIRIFSRMSPDGKVQVVKLHQAHGLAVGMCGDGGNDCGALRVAHAGVALSDAEASMVSPFSGKTKSVHAVLDLLREGR